MTASTIASLKSRFERLDKPDQADFVDLLETFCSVLGENWPAVLPAASAENLTNLPYDDPLPALDGGLLTNVQPSVWYQFPVTPVWSGTNTLLLTGDYADLLNEAIRLRVRYGNGATQFNTVASVSYSGATNVTTVVVGSTLLSSDLDRLAMSLVPEWADFPVTGFDVGTLGALELVRADAAGTALEGVAQGDLGVTGFDVGTLGALELVRADAAGTALEGVAQGDLGVTGFDVGTLGALELVRADAAGTALEGVAQGDLGVTAFGPGSATAGQFIRIDGAGSAPEGVDPVAAVTDLNQTISGTYTQSEVQAISDKVDELLAALRLAGFLAT